MEVEVPQLAQLLSGIQSLKDLTAGKICLISSVTTRTQAISSFTIDLESFRRWTKQLALEVRILVEYDGQSSQIVVKSWTNTGHQAAKPAMYQLFRKMSGKLNEEIGGHNLVATPFGQFILQGKHAGSLRVPDMCILSRTARFPLVVFQVGYAEDHKALFEEAERWLTGTLGVTELVIMMMTYRVRWYPLPSLLQSAPFMSSWGLSDDQIRVTYNEVDLLTPHIIEWYHQNGRSLSGESCANVYFCTKEDVHPSNWMYTMMYSAHRAVTMMAGSQFAPDYVAFPPKDDTSFMFCGQRFEFLQTLASSLMSAAMFEQKVWAIRLAIAKLRQVGVVVSTDHSSIPTPPEDEGFFYESWKATMDDRDVLKAELPSERWIDDEGISTHSNGEE